MGVQKYTSCYKYEGEKGGGGGTQLEKYNDIQEKYKQVAKL